MCYFSRDLTALKLKMLVENTPACKIHEFAVACLEQKGSRD